MRRSTNLLYSSLSAALLLVGFATACGDDDTTGSTESTETTVSTSSTTTSTTRPGGRTFTFSTADGTLVVEGEAGACTNPDETTLQVAVEGEDGRFDLDVTNGSGSVRVTANGTEFEGTVTSIQVGDTGEVTAAGRGSVADDSATGGATEFTITGSCA